MTRLYGGSDDLIEIDGDISDEIGVYEIAKKGIKFECSDGTIGRIKYNGEWSIDVEIPGHSISEHIKFIPDDENHEHGGNAKGATSYSDVLIFEHLHWIKIGRKTYRNSN